MSSPVADRLRAAQACASSPSSTAYTCAAGTSSLTLRAMAPDPVHRSTTTGASPAARAASMARPATTSVSGRGTKTPGPTSELELPEARPAGEVLQREAGGPLLHELFVCRGDGCAEHHRLAGVPDRDAEGVGRQHDGVALGRGDPRLGQPGRRRPHGRAQVRRGSLAVGHCPSATAAMRAASSASTADCTTGSRSPSSTASRL